MQIIKIGSYFNTIIPLTLQSLLINYVSSPFNCCLSIENVIVLHGFYIYVYWIALIPIHSLLEIHARPLPVKLMMMMILYLYVFVWFLYFGSVFVSKMQTQDSRKMCVKFRNHSRSSYVSICSFVFFLLRFFL